MNWVQIAWMMMIAASLMLGVVHLFVWQKQRSQYAHLLFFVLAVSAAAYGAFELARMRADTPAGLAALARWSHVPLAMVIISIVGFVRLYFDAGRLWLAYAVIGCRLAALALNFLTGVNVNFQEITALDHLHLWGGAVVSGPIGIPNPWAIVPQLGNLLLVAFILDASVTLWRRGGPVARRRAALVGGSLGFCILTAASFAALVVAGVVHAPTILMPGFFTVVLAMGYELVWDLIAAAQLAAQLRASEQRFLAVIQAVPSAILLINDKGMITLANAQAESVFGCQRAELIAKSVEMLIPERLRDRHAGLRGAYIKKPQARPMGTGRDLFGAPNGWCRNPGGSGAQSAADRGWHVRAGVGRRHHGAQAHRAGGSPPARRAGASLAGCDAGRAVRSLAHELNQPLTAILSNAQAAQRFLAQSPPRVDKLAEILTDIVKSDHRAGAVIQRLRSLLRKEEAERRPLDVNEVVEESLRLMRSDLLNRHVVVSTELAQALPAVFGDRNQLQQVLLNFLINGCDAMDGRQPDGQLVVRTGSNADGKVEVSVSDRGTGIPAADLERIFEPFVTTKSHGLGLGLAICRSIAEAHGGRLWATNNAGRGATLHCEFPPKVSDVDAEPAPIVYVVDDDPDVLKAIERLLGSAGLMVAAFPSPRQFLERYDRAAAGCLVLDLALPGLSGLDLQGMLEQQASHLPIVFLTGRGDIAASVQAMKKGASDFLTKPVDDAILIATIRDALARDRALRPARIERERIAQCLATLTERERQVLELIVAGRLNKQIAAELGTTEKTIKFHRGNLMRKMGVRVVADLVKLAERAGIGSIARDLREATLPSAAGDTWTKVQLEGPAALVTVRPRWIATRRCSP